MAAAREGRALEGAASLNGDSPRHGFLTEVSKVVHRQFRGDPTACRLAGMPRTARGHLDAGRYHVRTRSAGRIAHFRDDVDRTDFCRRLSIAAKRFGWRCESFCLMTTHFHLLLDIPEDGLQRGMHWLNGTYAQQFNRRHGRWGHLCGARYSLTPIESRRQLVNTASYISWNPVNAGMCERPEDHVWSSFAGTAGVGDPFSFVDDRDLLKFFGGEPQAARRRFKTYVERRREREP